MKKKIFTLLTLLATVCSGAWAAVVETVVVNQTFEDGTTTLFTGPSRITVANVANTASGSEKVLSFATAHNSMNGYSLATYDFSSAIGDGATAVKVAFDFYIPNANASYRRFFTIGQASLRTGFAKQSYPTAGSMFAFGLARNSSANYFSINGASTTAAASATNVIAAWAHAEITVDLSAKNVDYKITSLDGLTTYYSGDNVSFTDASAATCNQIDFFDCANSLTSYLDNLVITKYVDQSKVATKYTVKYQNAGGTDLKDAVEYDTYVGDTYTASSTDMATFYSDDTNTKYIYASGNAEKTATSTASENVITLVFSEYAKVAYTVTAKCGETELGSLGSGDAYADGSTTIYWNKYKQFNDQWYVTENPYGKTITEAGNTDIAYTTSNISYFFECESMTKSRSAAATNSGTGYSGGYSPRHYANSYWYTSALAGGTYTLTAPYVNNNSTSTTISIYYRDGEGNLTDTGKSITGTNNSSGTLEATGIVIPEGYSLVLNNTTAYNSNVYIDYIELTKTGVPMTITSAGWASFSSTSEVAIPEGVTAYYASASDGSSVTLTEIDGDYIPANTGVIINGTEGTYYATVTTTSATVAGTNLLQAWTTAGTPTAGTYYTLAAGPTFAKSTGGTLAAGKAYLVIPAGARELSVNFGETTGINQIDNGQLTIDNSYYNIAGQRVAQPTKGLYIVNGKKVIIK